jgi:hypothetical protein
VAQKQQHALLVSWAIKVVGRYMPRSPTNKAMTNEIDHPYVVELAVGTDGLDFDLGRRIMHFHKSRHIQLRYGRTIPASRGKVHYRWCFSDLLIARAFAEQFNGKFCKPSV